MDDMIWRPGSFFFPDHNLYISSALYVINNTGGLERISLALIHSVIADKPEIEYKSS